MENFDARKHFNNSSEMYKKLDKQFDYYIRFGVFAKKLNLKRLNNWACQKASDALTAELKLLAANMDLLQLLIVHGYVK